MWKPDVKRIAETVQNAPSIFNSKPWMLDPLLKPVAEDRIELHAESNLLDWQEQKIAGTGLRARVYTDPLAREFAISCGAALFNLRLAIRVAGHECAVWLLPDRKPGSGRPAPDSRLLRPETTLLASVEIVTGRVKPPSIGEQELYEAIWRRQTNRWPYTVVRAPLPLITTMEHAAAREGASLRLLSKHQAGKWMRLVAGADDDLAARLHGLPPDLEKRYRLYRQEQFRLLGGVRPESFGPSPAKQYPRTRRDFWRPGVKRPFERHPQLMALSTQDDQLLDWLRAGQALQRAILTGTRYSVSAPYGLAAEYHAPHWYGVPASGHLLRHDDLARYGLSVSFLTQPLECYDIEHPPTLENIHGEPDSPPRRFLEPRRRPWRSAEPRHWPWRWRFAELPQMVLRVGYAAVPAEQDDSPARSGRPAHRGRPNRDPEEAR